MFTLGHVSDWHATSPVGAAFGAYLNKRAFGWLSWKTKRQYRYLPEVFERLLDDVKAQAPDHVAVTGDLTNIALEQEFIRSAELLRELGPPEWVSVIPGNHDSYTGVPPDRSWDYWAPYMWGDGWQPGSREGPEPATDAGRKEGASRPAAPRFDDYPVLRERGELAIIGVCTAQPTALFQASGRVGEHQLERLAGVLRDTAARGLCRVVLVHHPPCDEGVSWRRRMRDSAAFRRVIAEQGAELILHGHRHRTVSMAIPGPAAPVPVLGVRSSSYGGSDPEKLAHYHLLRVERVAAGFRIEVAARRYDRQAARFVEGGSVPLVPR